MCVLNPLEVMNFSAVWKSWVLMVPLNFGDENTDTDRSGSAPPYPPLRRLMVVMEFSGWRMCVCCVLRASLSSLVWRVSSSCRVSST